jgi:pyruvate formate lyase activating enzyme
MTVREVLDTVERDSCFYARSAGGLTLSGGEPLFQPEFALELLTAARRRGLDTAIETSGHADWECLDKVCQHIDSLFYDIKSLDPNKHRQFTKVSNELILRNFEKVVQKYTHLPIIVRTPVVPGFNDTSDEIGAIARFVGGHANVQYELLPYHAFGESKYGFLGRSCELNGIRPPDHDHMRLLKSAAMPWLSNSAEYTGQSHD